MSLVDLDGLIPITIPDGGGGGGGGAIQTPTLENYLLNNGFAINHFDELDAIQMLINGNTITLDVYIHIRGGNLELDGENVRNLIIQGIELWGGDHNNVFGHDITIDVNVYERSIPRWFLQRYIPVVVHDYNQWILENRGIPGGGIPNFLHADQNYGRDAWTPRMPGTVNLYIRMRERLSYVPTLEFIQTVTHEFGHAFGIGEAWYYECGVITDLVSELEVMAQGPFNLLGYMYFSNYTIEKLILAMITRQYQSFGDRDDCVID